MAVTPSEAPCYRMLIGSEWVDAEATLSVLDKYTGEVIGRVPQASREDVREAVAAAEAAFAARPLSPQERWRILYRVAEAIGQHEEELARMMIAESGFTWRDVRGDIRRAVQTLQVSAEEAKRIGGEVVPIQSAPGFEGSLAFTLRVPLGVVCAITPFNSPLNTVCHKVAPALAAGNTVVLKPATPTPITALRLAELFLEAGLPPGHLNVVTGRGGEVGRWLCEDTRIRFYTFTGSTDVGREIQRFVGLRRSCMELGNISATIVCEDGDLERAVPLIVNGAFRKAGQVCTSVQRILAQGAIYASLVEALRFATERLKVGDPRDPHTDVGPMIDEQKAVQAEQRVQEAVARGATVVVGGTRQGPVLYPTILVDVPDDAAVVCEEIFAPVVSVRAYDSLDEALRLVNAGPYGLQAGIFTRDLGKALRAARELRVGGVIVNGTSSTRADLMPYGGTKDSGFGREGPRYAIEEMSETRIVLFYQ
ncbi:MAG: aldehyde dehydrogenase family protein [Armatimonadota bacterium]|nr:aldehyde dehydrogenase family protein [Armatimonadota bacterium]MDR7428198.1 aldehyde dehydrogenase family protein [Armatimonadota bacterium]MDR7469602.1 aldehyde dehydrogenase family protein [Armatimonadota bacterium]